jgi:ATP-binding cassette subfamily B (MDR/TAP) protein 1
LVLDTPARGGISQGDFLIVFMSVLMSAMGLGQAVAISPDFSRSRGAAANVFGILNRTPLLDSNVAGLKDVRIEGVIEFQDVDFRYPSRPDALVLRDINIHIRVGQVVAFVGHSGAGKSTIVGLLERFYDVARGSVMIDGRDIREYNLRWLRRQIGLVSQEPTLFDTTILENIKFGKPEVEVTDEEVYSAAKMANAHEFIVRLDDGYKTRVGERGTQLSGKNSIFARKLDCALCFKV